MYGQSPYGSTMNRGMFMDPQMMMMLQMRDQMRAQYAPQPTEMPLPAQDAQMSFSDLLGLETQARQIQPQEMSTEDSLMQVQQVLTNMQQQQQRLSEHLGAGSGMLRQLQAQGGLGGLFQQLRPQPAISRLRSQGPESMRLQAFPVEQGNPFGG